MLKVPSTVLIDCFLMSHESASRHLHKLTCFASFLDVVCHSRILVYRSRHVNSNFLLCQKVNDILMRLLDVDCPAS